MSSFTVSDLVLHLWQSSLFALSACVVLMTFRKGSTWSRHFIAWAAYLKFLVPFSLFSEPMRGLLTLWNLEVIPNLEEMPQLQALSVGLDLEYWLNDDVAVQASGGGSSLGTWAIPALIAIWALGATGLFARRWMEYRKFHVTVMQSSRPACSKWTNLAQSILGNNSLPNLLISNDRSLNAGVFGIVSSTIVIPEKMDTVFDASDREAFLRHELQHVLKHDNLWLFLQKCIRDLFWFHPLVCWLDRQISWEREMMRDEEVLNKTKNKNTYLSCLMKASKIDLPQSYATSVGLTGSPFSRRIKAIASYRSNVLSKALSGAGSIVAVLALVALFSVSSSILQAGESGHHGTNDGSGKDARLSAIDQSLKNARLGLAAKEAGKTSINPKLTAEEKVMVKEVMPYLETDKSRVQEALLASVDEDSSAALYFLIGNFYAEDKNAEEAMLYYEGALEIFPNFLRAAKNLAFMKVRENDFESGKKYLLKAYSLAPKPNTTICGLLGLCYINLEEYATAEYYYKQAIDLDPTIKDWKIGLSKALLKQEKYEEAIPLLEEAKAMPEKTVS